VEKHRELFIESAEVLIAVQAFDSIAKEAVKKTRKSDLAATVLYLKTPESTVFAAEFILKRNQTLHDSQAPRSG